jgi:RNA polymerase sigma-70 factor (ECF subfamily)
MLARSVQGDAAAFADIVQEHQAMVFSIAYHFLHDCAVAEEVAQEVFLHLYRNLAAIKSAKHLVLWLRKVTCHRCIDEVRRVPAVPTVSLEAVAEPRAEAPDPDPLLSERLRRMVAALPEDARAVIILRYQEELNVAEIAEILDIPLNTVKSRLHRSLEILRERFRRLAGEVPA